MSDTTRTSVSMPQEMFEYVQRNDLSCSELLQDAIKAQMKGDSEEARIRSQLNELQEEKDEISDKEERLEAQIDSLESRLNQIESAGNQQIDDLLDKLSHAKENIDKGNWQQNAKHTVSNTTMDITPDQFVAALNYAVETEEVEGAYGTEEVVPNEPLTDSERQKAQNFIEEEVL